MITLNELGDIRLYTEDEMLEYIDINFCSLSDDDYNSVIAQNFGSILDSNSFYLYSDINGDY